MMSNGNMVVSLCSEQNKYSLEDHLEIEGMAASLCEQLDVLIVLKVYLCITVVYLCSCLCIFKAC